jgi:hypothetical protein
MSAPMTEFLNGTGLAHALILASPGRAALQLRGSTLATQSRTANSTKTEHAGPADRTGRGVSDAAMTSHKRTQQR